jgi:hypothetical protein
MKKSEQIQELAVAFAKAQGELKPAHKNSDNPYHKSKYADLADVWEPAREVLSKHGLSVSQLPEFIEGRGWVLVNLLLHSSGQWIASELPLKPAKDDNQGFGATLTYMRRYGIGPLVGIVVDDDDDGETADGRGKTRNSVQKKQEQNTTKLTAETAKTNIEPIKAEEPKISNNEYIVLQGLLKQLPEEEKKTYEEKLLVHFKIESLYKLTKSQFDSCLISINNKLKKHQDIKVA